jgi:hypothetical protein
MVPHSVPGTAGEVASGEPRAGTLEGSNRSDESGVEESRRRFTLDQLSIGKPNLHTLPGIEPTQPVARAEHGLERNLAQGALEADKQRSMTPDVWISRVINQSATGLAPPRSVATISVVLDGNGKVTSAHVLQANSGFELWKRVALRSQNELSARRLHNPVGRPLKLTFEVESKVQLPSGRSPGTGVSVLGIPLEEPEQTRCQRAESTWEASP